MLVTIIIPVYNVSAYIGDCLLSVMRQGYAGEIECLIVDDCGTDDSMTIVERMVAAYQGPVSFRILHHERNRGLSAARNTGMDAAQGEYILFLDSDDELTEDSIRRLAEPLEKERYDVVLGFVKYVQILSINEKLEADGPQVLSIKEDILLRTPMILDSYIKKWAVVAWNRLYRTGFLRQYHLSFKEGLIYEDNLWSFQIACLAETLYMVSHTTYIHKYREGSIMAMEDRESYLNNWAIIFQGMNSFVAEHGIEKSAVFSMYNTFFTSILNHYLSSKSDYRAVYIRMRPYIKLTLSSFVKAHRSRFSSFFPDLHYLLPARIAPLWQLYGYNRYMKLKKRNHLA